MLHARRIVYYILLSFLSVSTIFLTLRVLFRLFGANPLSPISLLIYGITDVILLPFIGVFDNQAITNDSLVDIQAVVALFVYMVIIPLLMVLTRFLTRGVSEAEKIAEEGV